MKRLAVFLDGTWNEPDSNTNVWRLKTLVAAGAPDGTPQLVYYHTGVGTAWYNRLRGGAFGEGLSDNIRQAYQWLIEQYDDGDEIYLFGFSRGAFTARSLAGLIASCGLLRPGTAVSMPSLFKRYRTQAKPIWQVTWDLDHHPDQVTREERTLAACSRRVPIHFIGVWDTVGALGIPFSLFHSWNRRRFQFHNTHPSKLYRHVYHALAVDENRADYQATLWTRFVPTGGAPEDEPAGTAQLEQRWFVGAHANVGGGYDGDTLASIPLAWLHAKATAAGLAFRGPVTVGEDDHRGVVVDSFGRFMFGLYRLARLGRRHWRVIAAPDRPVVAKDGTRGVSRTINETVDETVLRRWREDPTYRPRNVGEWARRVGVTL